MNVTKLELLLAVAMSEFFQTTHVLFLPVGKQYVDMLKIMVRKKYVVHKTESFYVLTSKGRSFITRQQVLRAAKHDKAIDEFVNKL